MLSTLKDIQKIFENGQLAEIRCFSVGSVPLKWIKPTLRGRNPFGAAGSDCSGRFTQCDVVGARLLGGVVEGVRNQTSFDILSFELNRPGDVDRLRCLRSGGPAPSRLRYPRAADWRCPRLRRSGTSRRHIRPPCRSSPARHPRRGRCPTPRRPCASRPRSRGRGGRRRRRAGACGRRACCRSGFRSR